MSLEVAQSRYKSTGRNDACPCGSTKKYKKCHHTEDSAAVSAELSRLEEQLKAAAVVKAAEDAEQAESEGKKASGKAGAKKSSGSAAGAKQGSRSKDKAAQTLSRLGSV